MSCRVFERRVEFVFIDWLARKIGRDLQFDYRPTDRNKPFRDFLEALGVAAACEGSVSVKSSVVNQIGDADRDLFEVKFQST